MAYRTPAMAWRHAARDAGSGALTLTTGTLASGVLARLIDNFSEGSKLLQVTADSSEMEIDLDLGAGTLPTINQLLIPRSHNLDTATVTVQQDDNAEFSSATQLGQVVSPGTGPIDLVLTTVTERYLRLRITSAPTTVEIGEVVYSEKFEIADPDPNWSDHPISNVRLDELPVIDVTTEQSEERRRIEIKWNRLISASKTALDALRTGTGGRRDPFWIWSPDDSLPVAWVRFQADPSGQQASPNPGALGPQYDREFSMLERLG